jgi:hypothetical protein
MQTIRLGILRKMISSVQNPLESTYKYIYISFNKGITKMI